MKLAEKVCIVTGGGRGIGLAISRALANEGARVVIASRNPHTGQKAAQELGGCFFEIDVTRRPSIDRMIAGVLKQFGRVDVLVNNAAVHAAAPFAEETPELWERMYTVNVMGTVFPSQAVVPVMLRQGGGRIVHIASKAGVVGEPGHAAYSASKGAVIALTRAMAIELAPAHITVNAVAPGPVLTDMLMGVFPNSGDREALGKEAPLGRLGRPEDVAGAVLLLASDDADWITGQVINVDGGFSVLK
ncbi:MAG TPA: SDR family oxidoreductase [Anaerolineaceae bacterium]|nr:SDR family oxidoreductase [Anaerolineaceae bacterium]